METNLGNYVPTQPKVLEKLFFALLAVLVPSIVALVTVSSIGARYAERIDQQTANFANALKSQGDGLADRITQFAAASAERSNALSARLNSQEEGVRNTSVLSARQDEQLGQIKNQILVGAARRDKQIDDLNDRLGILQEEVVKGQLASARVEALLGQVLATVTGQAHQDNGVEGFGRVQKR